MGAHEAKQMIQDQEAELQAGGVGGLDSGSGWVRRRPWWESKHHVGRHFHPLVFLTMYFCSTIFAQRFAWPIWVGRRFSYFATLGICIPSPVKLGVTF